MTLLRRLLFNGLWIALVVFVASKGYEFFSTVDPTQGVAQNAQQPAGELHTSDRIPISALPNMITENTAIVISVLWDVTCPFCNQELRYLQDAYGDNSSVMLIGINLWDSHADIDAYVADNGLTSFTMFSLDAPQPPQAVPKTQVMATDGTILGEFSGWDEEYGPIQIAQIITGGL
jgi:hypothetical protein